MLRDFELSDSRGKQKGSLSSDSPGDRSSERFSLATVSATRLTPPAYTDRIVDYAFCLLLGGVFCYLVLFFTLADIRSVLVMTPDDAYYYFKVAENIAAGKGMTFDGMNQTNGFHPLWLVALVPLFALYHGSPETMTRVIMVIQAVLMFGPSLLVYSMLSHIFSKRAALVGGGLFVFWGMASACRGVESPLLIGGLVLLFYCGWKWQIFLRHNSKAELIFGILLGLVLLSRLDYLFVALAIGVYGLLKLFREPRARKENLVSLALIILGASLVVVPYLVYNKVNSGGFVPISGQLKSTFPEISITWRALLSPSKAKLMIMLVTIGYMIWFFSTLAHMRQLSADRRYFRTAMSLFGAAVLMHYTYTVLYISWEPAGWSFVGYNLLFCLIVAELYATFSAGMLAPLVRGGYWWFILLVAFTGSYRIYQTSTFPRERRFDLAWYETAQWVKTNTAPTDVLAAHATGILSFFSGRSVINLDGLVNNMEYQEVLRRRQLVHYLDQRNVKYLCHWHSSGYGTLPDDYGSYRIKYHSYEYKVDSDDILVRQSDEVFRTSTFYHSRTRLPHKLVVWRINYAIQAGD